MGKLVVHISEVDLADNTGMGRVELNWQREFERRGHRFVHIGPAETGPLLHRALFPGAARREYSRLGEQADLLIAHEFASGGFVNCGAPLVVESHGIERRGWQLGLERAPAGLKARILWPLMRLRSCDRGLRKADLILASNSDDQAFVRRHYKRDPDSVLIFKNGVTPSPLDEKSEPDFPTCCFAGSWTERKGIRTLVKAAVRLHDQGDRVRWLIGTYSSREAVLHDWPEELHEQIEVVSNYGRSDEHGIFEGASLFVLPSRFEGQSLSLLQAMETGRCCITTDCCGQKDVIVDGENGLLFQTDDAEQLAALIRRCLKDRELRQRLGHNARESMRERSWETTSSELVDRLECLMG